MYNLSIVIPVYNDALLLVEVLDSLCIQDYSPIELIIIDSSENDDSSNITKKFAENKNLDITLKKIPRSYAGKSMNLGIELSRGKFIGFLDTKTVPLENWVKSYLEILENQNIDIVFGSTLFEAETNFQKTLRAASYGNIHHESVPGSIVNREVFTRSKPFQENIRAAYDIEWRERVKSEFRCHNPPTHSIVYSKLPDSLRQTLWRYILYSFHTARVEAQTNVKQIYLSILLILSAIIIPKWNLLISGWKESPLYIADVTKIYLLSIILLLLILVVVDKFFKLSKKPSFFLNSLKLTVFIFLSYSVYRWNAILADWAESAILYIPHITKIYISLIIFSSILYRGFILPKNRKEDMRFLKLRWIRVGFLGLLLDLVKAPGYILGALRSLYK